MSKAQFASIEARDAIIKDWLAKKAASVAAVEAERDARQAVTQMLFPNPVKGTQRYPLGNGYNVKLAYGTNYTLFEPIKAADRYDPTLALVESIEALGNEGPAIANRLFKFKIELSPSEYEALDTDFPIQAEIKKLIDAKLTTKPASPQLDFEEPKTK